MCDNKNSFIVRNLQQRSFALVMTLGLLTLITVVVLAFFSRSVFNTQIEGSSTGRVKSEILAQGVISAIIGELRNEMLAGSESQGKIPDAQGNVILNPLYPTNMVPQRVLTPTIQNTEEFEISPASKFNNLIKQSISGGYFYAGGQSPSSMIKATAVKTTTPSLEGRFIPLSLWEKPKLIGNGKDNSFKFDSDNQSPEWVLMTRSGIRSDILVSAAKNSNAKNEAYVIGRFAYNIYDQGGLLDVNSAGYPRSAQSTTNFQALKGTIAGADLSQLPGMNVEKSDIFVRWRNLESLKNFFSISPYFSYVSQFSLTNGFLKPWVGASRESDQRFTTRQDFLRYVDSKVSGISPLALPYLTTFSRDLNQPTLTPSIARPKIQSGTGGNDQVGKDDEINPSFLKVPVEKAFRRRDNSTARPGEPLLKQRFSLHRLAWLTYKGPTSTRGTSGADMRSLIDAGISTSFLSRGTSDEIQKYFGLIWNSNGYWTYDQGSRHILTLAEVATKGREPDFIELLKAGISAGSIAKAATDPTGNLAGESETYVKDRILDHAILQIAANIIDQYDGDGYSTRIRFTSSTGTEELRGIENLPYFYRSRYGTIITELPNPLPTSGGTFDAWVNAASLIHTGNFVWLIQPEVWNPHDVNCSMGNPRPTQFRIIGDTSVIGNDGVNLIPYSRLRAPPECLYALPNQVLGTSGTFNTTKTPNTFLLANNAGSATGGTPAIPFYAISLNATTSELTFSVPSSSLYREPTLFTKPNTPAGSELALGDFNHLRASGTNLFAAAQIATSISGVGTAKYSGIKCINESAALTTSTFIGMYYAGGPIRWVNNLDRVMTATRSQPEVTTGGVLKMTYRMQYKDEGGNWLTYDQKLSPMPNPAANFTIPTAPPADYTTLTQAKAMGAYMMTSSIDPRSSRFGMGYIQGIRGNAGLAARIDPSIPTDVIFDTGRPGANPNLYTFGAPYSLPLVEGWFPKQSKSIPGCWSYNAANPVPTPAFYFGMYCQNNPLAKHPSVSLGGLYSQYYADPDGVVRRATSAFVPPSGAAPAVTTIGLPLAKTQGTGAVSNQSQSRPIILNRPFHSVAELGYVYSGTPWKNLSFFTPESGDAGLLDLFCIGESDREDAVVAGKVNLNTRQRPVLAALLSGTAKDALNSATSAFTTEEVDLIAKKFIARSQSTTNSGGGTLTGIHEMVGRWNEKNMASVGGIDGAKSYTGFSADLSDLYDVGKPLSNPTMNNIQRFRETPIRALADVGSVRTWNLLIDVVVQSGRYPVIAEDLGDFSVQGEQHYWVHVAVDRFTGKILDQKVETVR